MRWKNGRPREMAKPEIVKCCFTCKHYHLFASRCDDKKGQLFLLDPKQLPCPAWEQEEKEHKGLFE